MLRYLKQRLGHQQSRANTVKKEAKSNQSSFSINWVIPSSIIIGPLPRSCHIETLQELGIQSILSLCFESEGTPPEGLLSVCQWERYPLPDSHWNHSLTLEALVSAIEKLHHLQSLTPPVYIHCVAAIERSPTVCLAYLCYFKGLKVWEALRYLKQVHPSTAPTSEQLKVIQALVEVKS